MGELELVKFWEELGLEKKPFIHPSDKDSIKEDLCYEHKNLEKYYEEKYWVDKGLFHTDLLPVPYAGNLEKAKIFLLVLNPGFNPSDYHAEESEEFKIALNKNLRQEFTKNEEYPLFYLNPKFLWTAGGQYWHRKLKFYIESVKEKKLRNSYIEATKYISQRIAILELMPYHSKNFTNHKLFDKIKSVEQMKNFIQYFVLPKVKNGDAGVICTRQVKEWGLKEEKNKIVTYKGGASRSASLTNEEAKELFEKFLYIDVGEKD